MVKPTQPWVEGNAVEGPDGRVYNLLRLESGWSKSHPIANKAILLRVPDGAFAGEGTGDAPPLVFDSIVDMPGGSCKFTVRRHGPNCGRPTADRPSATSRAHPTRRHARYRLCRPASAAVG